MNALVDLSLFHMTSELAPASITVTVLFSPNHLVFMSVYGSHGKSFSWMNLKDRFGCSGTCMCLCLSVDRFCQSHKVETVHLSHNNLKVCQTWVCTGE